MNDLPALSARSVGWTGLRAGLVSALGLCWIAASLATAAAPMPAGISAPDPGEGFAQLGGATTAVAVEARGGTRLAFVNIGPRVAVYDVSDPGAPTRLGQTGLLPEVSEGLAAEGGLLYVGTRRPGADDWQPLDTGPTDGAALHVFDTRDPAAPRALVVAPLAALKVGAVALDRSYAFVLTDTGVAVVDVKDPTAPRQVAQVVTPDPTGRRRPFAPGGIAVAGERLWVARPEGFFVIDVREPEHPKRLDAAYLPGPAFGVARLGRFALVAGMDGVDVVDLADPNRPELVQRLPLEPQPVAIAAEDDRAVVLVGAGRKAVVLDLADPARPKPIGTVALDPLDSEQTALALAGGRAFAALGRAGLRIIDVEAAAADEVSATARHAGGEGAPAGAPSEAIARSIEPIVPPLEHIDVAGDLIFGAAGAAGFFVVRQGAGGDLRLVGALQPERAGPDGAPRRVAFHSVLHSAGLVYAQAEADGLWVIDVRDPRRPVAAGPPVAIPGPRTAHGMARIGDRLFLPAADGTLHALDLADPARPLPAGRLPKLGITNLIANGEQLYATAVGAYGIGHLHVIDASRPGAPRYVRTVDFSVYFSRLAIGLGHLYLTGGPGELAVLDIAQPAHPFTIDRQKGFDVGQVGLVEGHMLAAHPGWVETVDLAIPAFPRRRGQGAPLPWGREDGGAASDVTVVGNSLLILRHQAGLYSLGSGDIDRAGRPYRPTAAALFLPWLQAAGAMPTGGDAVVGPAPDDPQIPAEQPAPTQPPVPAPRPPATVPPAMSPALTEQAAPTDQPAHALPPAPNRPSARMNPPALNDPPGSADPPNPPAAGDPPCMIPAAPAHVTVVIDISARMAEPWRAGGPARIESARSAARALAKRLEPSGTPVTLVALSHQARRRASVTDAASLEATLGTVIAVPIPPGSAAPIRPDLGLVAAARGLGLGSVADPPPGPRRVILLVAGEADARTWALAASRAGWLRAGLGAEIDVFVLDPPGAEVLGHWARLAGDIARAHPVADPDALENRVMALAGDCG